MKELNEKIYSYSEVSEFMNELHKIPAMEFSADKDDQQKHRIWLSFDLYNQLNPSDQGQAASVSDYSVAEFHQNSHFLWGI